MAKTYQAPDPKQEPESGSKKAFGVYSKPERPGPTRGIILAITAVLAILIVFLLYRLAVGEELQKWYPIAYPTSISAIEAHRFTGNTEVTDRQLVAGEKGGQQSIASV